MTISLVVKRRTEKDKRNYPISTPTATTGTTNLFSFVDMLMVVYVVNHALSKVVVIRIILLLLPPLFVRLLYCTGCTSASPLRETVSLNSGEDSGEQGRFNRVQIEKAIGILLIIFTFRSYFSHLRNIDINQQP